MQKKNNEVHLKEIFSHKKYLLLILVIFMLILGFGLMTSFNQSTTKFSNEIFSFRSITLAPGVIILAYIMLVFIILRK